MLWLCDRDGRRSAQRQVFRIGECMRVFRFRRRHRRPNRAFALADRARDDGQWPLAAAQYRKGLVREPGNPAIWVQLGHALKESGDLAGAETAYRNALELTPDDADTHLQLGHALKLEGRLEDAVAAYLRALTLDPALHHAAYELFHLGWALSPSVSAALLALKPQARPQHRRPGSPGASIVFDVSDLVHYFLQARVPTGIQRVQMNVVAALLREPAPDRELIIACFTPNSDDWVVVPETVFLAISDLAVAGGALDDPAWREALSELYLVLACGERLAFRDGAALVNMGTSWWLQNYFLMVRAAKERYGMRYFPFVHDCIPMLAPQHCTRGLTRDFISWLIGVFFHADGFLVNSHATAADLASAAHLLGHAAPQPAVIHLDACVSPGGDDPEQDGELLAQHGLGRRDFVLFVSTIESRKNHLLAFEAWLALIEKHGLDNTPMLVCVGNPGWLVETAMARLESSAALQQRVTILSKVSDAALAALYRHCLFTLYPSSYEGWGLPVTESLCYGKVPVVTRISSLPEAGGTLAEYFAPGDRDELGDKLERLIDDSAYRQAREAAIRRDFRPRRWRDIGEAIIAAVIAQKPHARKGLGPLPVELARYYPMSRNTATRVRPGMTSGEMYRTGHGWWPPDEWGCWLKQAEAEIAFVLPDGPTGGRLLYLGLRGTPTKPTDYRLALLGGNIQHSGALAADEERWVTLPIGPRSGSNREVRIRLSSSGHARLADAPSGYRPVVTLGVVGFYLAAMDDARAGTRLLAALRSERATRPPPDTTDSARSASDSTL